MTTDIIIPHFGPDELLERCKASIEASTEVDYNLIVIDNNEHNRGFSKACNEGIKQGSGEYVVFLNNDTQVPDGWLQSMIAITETDPKIAAVGPLSTAKSQWQWQHSVARMVSENLPANDYITNDVIRFPDPLAFWCVLIPKRVLDDVGLLDEQFFMYAEDDDWCLRADQAGYKLALDLSTVVQHDHRTNYSEEVQRIHQESVEKLMQKWEGVIQRPPNVMMAVLNQGEIRTELTAKLVEFLGQRTQRLGKVVVTFTDDKPIANNRNKLVKEFLEDDWDYLVMIDSDTMPRKSPLDLVSYNLPIIGMPAPIYNVKFRPDMPVYWNVGKWNDTERRWHPYLLTLEEGLIEVDAVGTGCMVIRRDVLEHPELRGPFRRAWDEDGLAVRGLDFEFCRRAREVGYKVYVNTDYVADHFKQVSLLKMWELLGGPDWANRLDGRELGVQQVEQPKFFGQPEPA